jgi:hypothetical protein
MKAVPYPIMPDVYINAPSCMDTNQKTQYLSISQKLIDPQIPNTNANLWAKATHKYGTHFYPKSIAVDTQTKPQKLTVNYKVDIIEERSYIDKGDNLQTSFFGPNSCKMNFTAGPCVMLQNAPTVPVTIDILPEPTIPTFPFNLRGWVPAREPIFAKFLDGKNAAPGWIQINYTMNFHLQDLKEKGAFTDDSLQTPGYIGNDIPDYGICYYDCPNLSPPRSIFKYSREGSSSPWPRLSISAADFCRFRESFGDLAYNLLRSGDSVVSSTDPFYYRITDTCHSRNIWYQKHVSTFLTDSQILLDARVPNFDSTGKFTGYGATTTKPKIGSVINGPFIQPGTVVVYVSDTPNLPSADIPGHLVYISKPMTARDDKIGDAFVYTFN